MGEKPQARTSTAPASPSPDTEHSGPPTPSADHISVDIDSNLDTPSEKSPSSDSPQTRISASPVSTQDSPARLSVTEQSAMSPLRDTRPTTAPEVQDSNTTLQSMKRPEELNGGVPHTRRFLSIEREIEQSSASIKLLQKRLDKAQKDVKIAWIAAAVAGALGLAALLL